MESDLSMTCDPGLGVSPDVSSDDCKHRQAQSDFNQITERRERLWEGFITKDRLDDGEQETVDTELGTDCNEDLSTTLQVGFIQNSYNHGSFTDNVTMVTQDVCSDGQVKERLDLHLRWHAGEKVAICEICDKLFTKLDYLKKHVKAMHTEQTGFKCQYCSKVCSLKNNLRIHLRTHTGEKPFRCEVCGKTFSQSSQVKSHLLTNHQQLHNPDDSDKGVFMVGSEEESSLTAD
ncbi:zinc finger protein 225-like [Haliotis rufescens]|uniref:zinc finger protein 225-like n=1 Tax=Haliotis rufescens TaxID=6454 RepID=UPI00201F1E34|nr:zinc finger protein 225-like [Haliotis rufescens]